MSCSNCSSRHQLDIERPYLRDRSERKSIFEIVSRHYNPANWISSSFPLKTEERGFYEKISANCFEDPAVFSFIFLYNCFKSNSKQKLLWSSISPVNNSYKLLIKLLQYFDYFKTNSQTLIAPVLIRFLKALDRYLKNCVSKSIVLVIKHAKFQLYRVHHDGVIYKTWQMTTNL